MANFVVEFPLKTEKYQEDILNKRFEIGDVNVHNTNRPHEPTPNSQ